MMADRKKPGVAFWATVALVAVLVGYPLSAGPACWLTGRKYFRASTVNSFYRPVLWSASKAQPLKNALVWWGSLGLPDGIILEIETDVLQFIRTKGDVLLSRPGL
jgi:hypothetical protein